MWMIPLPDDQRDDENTVTTSLVALFVLYNERKPMLGFQRKTKSCIRTRVNPTSATGTRACITAQHHNKPQGALGRAIVLHSIVPVHSYSENACGTLARTNNMALNTPLLHFQTEKS